MKSFSRSDWYECMNNKLFMLNSKQVFFYKNVKRMAHRYLTLFHLYDNHRDITMKV